MVADIPAGKYPNITLGTGQSVRIVTGAVMPRGADAAVPVEDTNMALLDSVSKLPSHIQIYSAVGEGDSVRHLGQDYKKNDLLIDSN